MGKFGEAKQVLERAVSIMPDFTPAYLDLAQACIMSGDKEKAMLHLKKVIELSPDTPIADDARKKLKELTS
jgi:FimV-like protein